MVDEIQLKVENAYPIDVGRGIIRLDPTALLKLQLSPGDIVEIRGKKKTTAKVWRADRQDWEQGIVRIDNFIRQNADVSIGEKATVKKAEAPVAKKLILALPESDTPEVAELRSIERVNDIIKRAIIKRPVFKGDIVPIVYSTYKPEDKLTSDSIEIFSSSPSVYEPLITTQKLGKLILLTVVDTEPSDSIVQVLEETKIAISAKRLQNKEDEISELYKKFIMFNGFENNFKLYGQPLMLSANKKDNEVDIFTLSEAIVKTKDHYEKISSNIKEYNANYAVEDSITLTNLDNIVIKSDKIVYEYIYNLKLQDAFNYINELDLKLETHHKAALSETAHRKIKEIEFQINSPFSASKLRKNYKKLVSEFDKLDTAAIQGTKSIKEFMEISERLMEKLQETEDDVEEEQKTGIRSTLKNVILWGIPVLFSFYSLVADDYFTVDFYTPIIFYIFLSIVIYLLLKSGINFKIIYLAYKTRIYKPKKYESLILIIPLLVTPIVILASFKDFTTHSNLSFYFTIILILSFISMMIGMLFTLKDSVKEAKSKLIEKEINSLTKRYELDTLIQP